VERTRKESGLKLRLLYVGAAAAIALSAPLFAQGRPELRADAIVSRETAIYAGAGVLFPVGTYVRTGIVGGAGMVKGDATVHADLVGLFHTDPFRESKWAPYGGGGISLRHDSDESRSSLYLLALLGVEGPPSRGFAPAIELGLGGGVRAGVILRRADSKSR
jgi:hypothetical protein